MNLIHIVDKLNDKEYIYSNGLEISLQQAANSLVNKLTDAKWSTAEYNIHEDKCEIFINEQVIERGWVWNSKNTTKKILYKLSYIPIFNIEQKPKQIDQSVQTDEIKDKCTPTTSINKNTSINFDNFFEVGDIHRSGASARQDDIHRSGASARQDDIHRSGASARQDDIHRSGASARQGDIHRSGASARQGDYKIDLDLGLGYGNNMFDPVNFNPFAQKTNIWSTPSNKYAIDYTVPCILSKSSVKVPLDDKVLPRKNSLDCTIPFIYDLNVEIKKRLTLPNFGLRRFKQE
jgi:hypothetical protein